MNGNQVSTFIVTVLCALLCQPGAKALASQNLLSNPGFETGSALPWQIESEHKFGISETVSIESERSFFFEHGNTVATSTVSQSDSDWCKSGSEYIFSINVRLESGTGQLSLIVDAEGMEPIPIAQQTWDVSGTTHWQKYQLKFEVPTECSGITLSCRVEDATETIWIDWARLIKADNLIRNGDFELDGDWQSGNGSFSDQFSYFGSRSFSIDGSLKTTRSAQQVVDLTAVPDADERRFTIAAHLKTIVKASSEYQPATFDCNSDDFDEDLDPVRGSGAQLRVVCLSVGKPIRTLQMPFFESHCEAFIEQRFCFLVPAGTDGLIVELAVFDSDMQAIFDNVRLTCEQPPSGFYRGNPLGHTASVIEAPEPDTSIVVSGPTQLDIENAMSSASDFANSDYGKIIWLPANEYIVERILPPSRITLKMHRHAFLRRSPTGLDAFRGSLIRNDDRDQFNRVSDVVIEGGHYLPAFSPTGIDNNNLGNVVALYGDRIVFRNFVIREWSQTEKWIDVNGELVAESNSDLGLSFLGHDVYVYHNTVQGPAGNLGDGSGPGALGFDGIHYFGGERAHFMENNVYAGDDGIGLYTGTIPLRTSTCDDGKRRRLFIYNRNIRDVEIFNNQLSTNWGRAVACGLARPRSREADLTAVVENIRARHIFGKQGGAAGSLTINCIPRPTLEILPGDQCPTTKEALADPKLFPDRSPQIRNIDFSDMLLTVDLANQPEGFPVQQAVRVYSESIGSVENITISDITLRVVCDGPCDWLKEDQPKNLLEIRRGGLLCEIFELNQNSGELVFSGFAQVGLSHRNFNVRIENCLFLDETDSFLSAYHVDSTEPQDMTDTDVNDVEKSNLFQPGLTGSWQVVPSGIHD